MQSICIFIGLTSFIFSTMCGRIAGDRRSRLLPSGRNYCNTAVGATSTKLATPAGMTCALLLLFSGILKIAVDEMTEYTTPHPLDRFLQVDNSVTKRVCQFQTRYHMSSKRYRQDRLNATIVGTDIPLAAKFRFFYSRVCAISRHVWYLTSCHPRKHD